MCTEPLYLFELEDNEHVRSAAVGVHVGGGSGSSPRPLLHQLLHLQTHFSEQKYIFWFLD